MKGIGILVDALAILLGGSLGAMIKYEFPAWVKRLTLQAIGLVAMILGAISLLGGWFPGWNIGTEMEGTFLVVVALLMGALFGEALCLDRGLDKLGASLRKIDRRSAAAPKNVDPAYAIELRTKDSFVDGFAITGVLCAFSSLALSSIVGTDSKTLLIKAAAMAVTVLLLGKVYGVGVCFAVVPALVVSGLSAYLGTLKPDVIDTAVYAGHVTVISSVILVVAGLNLAFGKRLRAVNLIPAFAIGPLYWWATDLITKSFDK